MGLLKVLVSGVFLTVLTGVTAAAVGGHETQGSAASGLTHSASHHYSTLPTMPTIPTNIDARDDPPSATCSTVYQITHKYITWDGTTTQYSRTTTTTQLVPCHGCKLLAGDQGIVVSPDYTGGPVKTVFSEGTSTAYAAACSMGT